MLLPVLEWDEGDAPFGADPSAYAAARAFFKVENVPASESFGEEDFLVGVFHGECAFENVLDPLVYFPKDHC
jgi:hypothetical protein